MKTKMWEHKIIDIKKSQKQLEMCLDHYGDKGWELVNLDSTFQLKEKDKLDSAEHFYRLIFKKPKYDE